MSKYTTGEIAKLCGVSVRTVQYYDDRNILVPSEVSDGGRRLYSDEDVKRLHIICFLRETGLPLNSIAALITEKNPENIILILLAQHEQALREELSECQARLELVEGIKRELKEIKSFSIESIGDIAHVMKQKNKLKRMRLTMIFTGIPVTVLQWTSIVLWITNGLWWFFPIWLCVATVWGVTVSVNYFSHVAYICPECHQVFRSSFWKTFWAYHTPRMRRLTCPNCDHKGLCVEIYSEKESKNNG